MTSHVKIVNQDAPGIPVRRMDFEFDDAIPTFWFDGDPFRTLLLTALSCTFPEGERMFMRSVRNFSEGVVDPVLQKQVRAFIGQEANHGKEHESFNAMMNRKGLPVAKIEKGFDRMIKRLEKYASQERMLAHTCAAEHFTALFAEMILKKPEILSSIDPRIAPMWLWHAVEESEHKAVAFDVYQDQVDNYWVRVSEMAMVSFMFFLFTGLNTRYLLRGAGKSGDWRMVGRGIRQVFGRKGWLSGMLPQYLAYYRRDFHPNQFDASGLREKGMKLLDEWLAQQQAA